MALPEIRIVLTAVGDGAKRGIKATADSLDSLGSRAEDAGRRLQVIGDRITGLGKSLSVVSAGIVAAGAGMFALANSTADAGDRIAKTARAAGVSGQYFQEMAYAIGQVSDLSEGQFGDALGFLTKRIGDAATGSADAARALEALGFTQDQIASGAISTEDAFSRFVSKMDESVNPAVAAALSADLFGRSAASLGPQLSGAGDSVSQLREDAKSLGIVLSQDALDASESFNDQMDTLKKSVGGLKNTIGAALIPVLTNTLIPLVQEKVIPALASVAQKVFDLVTWFGNLPGPVQEAAAIMATTLGIGGPVIIAVGALATAIGGLVAATGPIGLLIAAATLLTAAWVTWGDDIKAAVRGAVDWVTDKLQKMVDFVAAIPDKMIETGKNIIQGLRDGIAQKWEEFREYLWSLVPEIPQIFKDALDIQSPSRVMAEIGGNIGAGLAQGIADSQGLVADAVRQISSAAVLTTDNMVSDILGSLGQMFDESKAFAIAQALINTWTGATEALKLPFPANLAAFAKVLATGMNAVRNIRSARPGGGGGATSGGAGGNQASTQAPQQPLIVRLTEFNPNGLFTGAALGSLLDALNREAGDRGYSLVLAR